MKILNPDGTLVIVPNVRLSYPVSYTHLLAKGNGISEIELFNQAHQADIEARRNRLEAKIARDSKPRKPIK